MLRRDAYLRPVIAFLVAWAAGSGPLVADEPPTLARPSDAASDDRRVQTARRLLDEARALGADGRHDDAIARLETAAATLGSEMRDSTESAAALVELGAAFVDAARPRLALPVHVQALAMRRRLLSGDSADVATSLGHLAWTYGALGRPADALPLQEEAVAMSRRLFPGDHHHVAQSLNGLAFTYGALGRESEALPLQEQALAMCRRLFPGGHPDVASGLNNLASTYRALGRPADGLPLQEEAVAMSRLVFRGDHPQLATSLGNLASTYDALGRAADGLALKEEALAMRRRLFPGDHLDVANGLGNLAFTYALLGHPANALPLLEEALATCRRLFPDGHPAVAKCLNSLGIAYDVLGRPAEAFSHLREAGDLARRIGWAERHVPLTLLGRALVARGRPEEAPTPLLEAIQHLEDLRSKAKGLGSAERAQYMAEVRQWDPYSTMVEALVLLGRESEALGFLERGRGREMLDLLERGRVDPLGRAEEEARRDGDAETVARIGGVREAVLDAEREVTRREQDETRARETREWEKTRAAVREASTARKALLVALANQSRMARHLAPEAAPRSPDEIRGLLSPGERLLFYGLGDRESYAFLVDSASIRAFPLREGTRPVTSTRLSAWVPEYVATLAEPVGTDVGWRRSDLFRALVPQDLWTEIRGASRLYVVGHGILHALPFEALVVETREGQVSYWLDEGPPIAYVASGSVLSWVRSRRDVQRRPGEPPSLVAVGNPVFARPPELAGATRGALERGRALAPLPGTREEVERIRSVFLAREPQGARVKVLLGLEATEAAVTQAVSGARFVHLATHGIVDETHTSSFSALALTMPVVPVPGDDGFLTLNDLLTRWRTRLDGTEMVVLSACDTQRGKLRNDEGVYALPWGFHFAGCPTVVATLWKVDDGSAPFLMEDFYRRILARDGEGRLAALLAAKRAQRSRHPHPYYWAPFVLLGDPR